MLSCALHRTSRPFVYLASLLIFAHILTAAAEKRQFVLEVTWKIAAPDCVQRRIVAINGTLPGPVLNVTTGDSLEVQVINRMPSEAVTIHWHGIRMTGSPWDDGAAFINQCPILPGGSYTYNFSVPDQAGTFWYHAHLGNLKSAGAFGLLVVSERARADYPFEFDVDKPFLIGDWIHADEAYNREYLAYTANSVLLNGIGRFNCTPTDGNVLDNLVACAPGQGALGVPSEPVCGETFLSFQAGKRYLLRMINTGDTEYLRVQFQGHNLTVVQADSSYTEPVTVDWLMVAPGQTYGAILQTDQPLGAYWFTVQAVLSATPACRAATNSDECATLTGTLLYEGSPTGQYSGAPPPNSPDLQEKQFQQHLAEVLQFDRRIRQHPRHIRAMPPVTRTITVGVTSSFDGTRPVFNLNRGESVLPATPLLHASYFGVPLETDTTSANTQPAGDAEALITLGPKRTPIYHIGSGDGVLVILQNSQVTPQLAGASTAANGLPTGDPTFNYTGQQAVLLSVSIPHSWHLHGHDFWVLGEGLGLYDPEESPKSFNLVNPIYRNVATHLPGGWLAVLFRADNPGAWLLHCHFDAHLIAGMFVTFLEGLPNMPLPPRDIQLCGALNSLNASAYASLQHPVPLTPSAPAAGSGPPTPPPSPWLAIPTVPVTEGAGTGAGAAASQHASAPLAQPDLPQAAPGRALPPAAALGPQPQPLRGAQPPPAMPPSPPPLTAQPSPAPLPSGAEQAGRQPLAKASQGPPPELPPSPGGAGNPSPPPLQSGPSDVGGFPPPATAPFQSPASPLPNVPSPSPESRPGPVFTFPPPPFDGNGPPPAGSAQPLPQAAQGPPPVGPYFRGVKGAPSPPKAPGGRRPRAGGNRS